MSAAATTRQQLLSSSFFLLPCVKRETSISLLTTDPAEIAGQEQ